MSIFFASVNVSPLYGSTHEPDVPCNVDGQSLSEPSRQGQFTRIARARMPNACNPYMDRRVSFTWTAARPIGATNPREPEPGAADDEPESPLALESQEPESDDEDEQEPSPDATEPGGHARGIPTLFTRYRPASYTC